MTQKIILTCSPKIASWIHFNFCNFIPQLSQVEADGSGQWHEWKEDQVSKKATLANIIQREPSHLDFLQGEKLQSVFFLVTDCSDESRFYSPSWAGWALFTLRVLSFGPDAWIEMVTDRVWLAARRLWLRVFYAQHDSCNAGGWWILGRLQQCFDVMLTCFYFYFLWSYGMDTYCVYCLISNSPAEA